MLTDDEARRLLQVAGETVPVDPTRTVSEPPRRPRWPVLVAAAAVVAVAVTSVVLTDRDGGGTAPDPAPPVPGTVQVPSVLGYDEDDATQKLTDAGLAVRKKSVPSCDQAGFASGTDPAAGTPLDRGSTVVLQVSSRSDGVCLDDSVTLARELLALADGRGPAPELADTVRVYEDSEGPVTITREQAADPETWRACTAPETCVSVLSRLSEAAHRSYPMAANGETRYQSPYLSTEPTSCTFEPRPAGLWEPDEQIGVATPVDGDFCTQDFVLDVYRNTAGEITAIALRDQMPNLPASNDAGPIDDLALQFHAFALGTSDLPPIGDEVDLYVGGAFTGFVTNDTADDPKAWETCTETGTYAGRDCPFSPLEVLRDRGQSIAVVDDPDIRCLARFDDDLPGIASADSTAIVPARTPAGCAGQFAVQLYVNDDGELIAVDLLLPKS